MPAVNSVLVVGGGLAGAGTAAHLARAGVAVELIEIKPDVAALGSGINWKVRSLAVFDNGGGPELYAAITDFIFSSVVRRTPSGWLPVGGMDGTVHALRVHDDGGGAAAGRGR